MSTWLFAENEFNRNIDENNKYFYFANNRKKLSKRNIATGDYIITYVTKIMKLTDIRIVTNNEPKILPEFIKYDRKFEYYLQTKLYKKLNRENWIDRSIIFPKLNIFHNKVINLVLLSAPIQLDDEDGKRIFELFN